jgi:hypothetical protein
MELCKRDREHYIASDKVALAKLAEMISSPGKHVALCSDDQAVFAAGSSVAGGKCGLRRKFGCELWDRVCKSHTMGDASSGKLLMRFAWYLRSKKAN